MTKEHKDFIKVNHKWPFLWSDIMRYSILIPTSCLLFLGLILFVKFHNPVNEMNQTEPLFYVSLFAFILGLTFSIFLIHRIEKEKKFDILHLSNDFSSNRVLERIESIKWDLVSQTDDMIILRTPALLFTWGDKVTLLKIDKNNVLVNTRPHDFMQLFTVYSDYNFRKVEELLNEKINDLY